MSLTIPKPVLKILTSRNSARERFYRIRKMEHHETGLESGAYLRVLVHKHFVVKNEKECPDNSRPCSLKRDYKFIERMRKDSILRIHFPESYLFNGLVVQERADPNYSLFGKYENWVKFLALRIGLEDIHEENIGWRKAKSKEPIPVFIDVGWRTRPMKPSRSGPKRPKWAFKGLSAFTSY